MFLSAIKNIKADIFISKFFESKLYFPGLFILIRQQILFIQYSNEATCRLVYDFLSLMIGWS